MCGIVGYLGDGNAVAVIQEGLHRLEYRGYDSAGIAVAHGDGLAWVKSRGKLVSLDERLRRSPIEGSLGIGHTRWATHGAPSETNAHPHFDEPEEIALVHNGIIENHEELRAALVAEGVAFRSDTDTEVLVHLVRKYFAGDLFEAVRRALADVRGAYALAVICKDCPDVLVAARSGSPLILGLGDGEVFVASDVPAILNRTRKVVYLGNGQVCEARRDGYRVTDLEGRPQQLPVDTVEWDAAAAEKGGYAHFMLKEIFQQPEVLRNTLRGRVREDGEEVLLPGMRLGPEELRACSKVILVACGTAWHAGLVGKHLIERFAKVPVEVDTSSEFRYREPVISADTLVMAISQSGETADTLEAVRIAGQGRAKVISIVNVVGSSIARESQGLIYTHAGPEVGVASTKAYTAQLTALSLFALHLGQVRGTLSDRESRELVAHLRGLPDKLQWCLDRAEVIEECARRSIYVAAQSALYLGRTFNYPTALEGALKLKEISYIHAEGYAAGEMKHGPIALITDAVPSICIAVRGAVYEKMLSNIQELRARQGPVLAVATVGDDRIRPYCDDVIDVPECFEPFSPIVTAVPIQLFAYYVAVNRGCDVDQPRNLAKSVTVE